MQDLPLVLEQDEDGVWVARCPGLPGCISQGPSEAAARANLAEAMAAFGECLAKHGESQADCRGREDGA